MRKKLIDNHNKSIEYVTLHINEDWFINLMLAKWSFYKAEVRSAVTEIELPKNGETFHENMG